MVARGAIALAVLVLAACGGTPSMPDDGGADAGVADGEAPTAPVAPAPVALTPCAAGWREVTSATGTTTCEPWPADGYHGADCAFDEAHFAGTPGCARVGTACAADGWPSDLPAGRTVVWVDDGAAAGGDGSSQARALRTIGAAILAAPAGAVIAVAIGHYDEVVSVGMGMTVWGACVSGTRITSSTASETDAAVGLFFADAGVHNVGIDAPARLGIGAGGAAGLTIDSVVVSGARVIGVAAAGGGSVAVTDVVVRGTRERLSDGKRGRGLSALSGIAVTVTHALVEDNREEGVLVVGPGTMLTATDLVVRGTRERMADGTTGDGVHLDLGAQVTLAGAVIEDDRDVGVFTIGAGTSLALTDAVVRGTRESAATGSGGQGVYVETGAHATLTRVLLDDDREAGLVTSDAGTSVDATDLVVRGTREQMADGKGGRGVEIDTGSTVTLARALVEDDRDVGVFASAASTLGASDLVVRGTRERAADGTSGRGLTVESGTQATLARALFDDNREVGVVADGAGTSLVATDLVVQATQPRAIDGVFGAGLWGQDGATVMLAAARVDGSHMGGVVTVGANVQATDLVVSGVGTSHCPVDYCVGDTGGFGLAALRGSIDVTRFLVEGAMVCGVAVFSDPLPTNMDLQTGVVTGSAVGACVQIDGYDTMRLSHDVQYRDVGVPLQATRYVLPGHL